MRVKLELQKLQEIADITKKLRRKDGAWQSKLYVLSKRQVLQKAFKAYEQFVVDLIKKHIPSFDLKKYKIDVTKIEVSPTADKLIRQILYGWNYVQHSLKVNKTLQDEECIIHEKKVGIIPPKEEI